MSYFAIFVLAFALSIDACIVSFSYGICFRHNCVKNSVLLGTTTALFQGIMPIAGYYLTGFVKSYIEPYSKLIVFVIFGYLGLKFIIDSFKEKKQEKICIDLKSLILIGVATSIDAFSSGITLSLAGNKILKPAILIAIVTYINSLSGFWLGKRLKHLPTQVLEIFAGVLLLILGIKAII